MKRLILSAALAAAAPSSAEAQSFLENMARRAAENVAGRAASALERRLTGGGEGGTAASPAEAPESAEAPAVMRPRARSRSGAPATSAVSEEAAATPGSTGPAPWPNNLGSPSLRRPGQLQFDAALEAEKTAFREFGMVNCNDCEGG